MEKNIHYLVKEEDTIEIRDNLTVSYNRYSFSEQGKRNSRIYSTRSKNKKLKFVRIPKFEEVPYPIVMVKFSY